MFLATAFAFTAIGGAYFLARGAAIATPVQASTETALLEQIATKDSTGDGLPDWEKALYGIPLGATTTDYFHLGMTDGEAVSKGLIVPKAATPAATTASSSSAVVGGVGAPSSNSLTDIFAQNFFTLYLAQEQSAGGSLSSSQVDSIASQALAQLTASAKPAPDFKTASDIKVAGTGSDAMRAYATAAEAVFRTQDAQLPKSELTYLQDYLNGDKTALPNIVTIAAAYRNIATGLAALTVPQEAAATHLVLVNALARIGAASSDFSHVDTDPLASMLALEQYPQAVTDMMGAFSDIQKEFTAENISIPAGKAGTDFVNVIPNAKTRAAAKKTP
jgi:hypothetical protein